MAGNLSVQDSQILTSTPALTANGNLFANIVASGIVRTDGYNGAIYLVIQKTGTGTATVTPQTNFDWLGATNGTFYNAGYQRVDGQATLTRATGAFTVAANTQAYVLQLLDGAPAMQFVVAVTGSVSILAWLYLVPA